MNQHKQILCSVLFFSLLVPSLAEAQRYLGVSTDGWSALNTLYLNPANIAGRQEKMAFAILSFSGELQTSNGSLGNTTQIRETFRDKKYYGSFNSGNNNSTFSMSTPTMAVRGPGFLWSINERHSIALTSAIRGFNQFTGINQSLYRTVADPGFAPTTANNFTNTRFNWTSQLWSELALSYAKVVIEPGEHQLNAGITVRYLGGMGFMSIKGHNLAFDYEGKPDSIHVTGTDLEFSSNVSTSDQALNKGLDPSALLNKFFGPKDGMGFGGDLGLTYFYRPYNSVNDDPRSGNGYVFRFSLSAIDLGFINYKAADTRIVDINGEGFVSAPGLLASTGGYTSFKDYANTQGFRASIIADDKQIILPATLVAGADFQVYKRFYVNATYMQNVVNRFETGNSFYNQLTIVPRFDSRIISIGLPVSYNRLDGGTKIGLGVRFTGFFIGSDDLLAAVSNKQKSFGFYIGGSYPIFRKSPPPPVETERFEPVKQISILPKS